MMISGDLTFLPSFRKVLHQPCSGSKHCTGAVQLMYDAIAICLILRPLQLLYGLHMICEHFYRSPQHHTFCQHKIPSADRRIVWQ